MVLPKLISYHNGSNVHSQSVNGLQNIIQLLSDMFNKFIPSLKGKISAIQIYDASNTALNPNVNSDKNLRDRIVSRHRCGEGCRKNAAALKIPMA